jgi:hypothetical protein
MKNLIFILLLFIIPFFAFSQDSGKTRKFSVGLNFSPDYGYRTLKTDNLTLNQLIINFRNEREKPKLGYTTGLTFNYYMNKRISFETGLLFSDKGEMFEWIDAPFSTVSNPEPIGVNININYHYYYLDIPLKTNIFLLTGQTKIYLSGGISTNIFISHVSNYSIEFPDGQVKKDSRISNENFLPVNFTALGGFGISYDIKERYIIKLEPTLRYPLHSIIDAPIKSYLYSAGLNLGLSYKL